MSRLGVLAAAVLVYAGCIASAHADTDPGLCVPRVGNPTPCTVTPAEFAAATDGMTRREVHRVFGLKGERIGATWFPDGYWRVTVLYPASDGVGRIYMRFVDSGPTQGDAPTLDHKLLEDAR